MELLGRKLLGPMYLVWGPDLENGWPWGHSHDSPWGAVETSFMSVEVIAPSMEEGNGSKKKKKSIMCSLASGQGDCFSKIGYEWELEEEEREEMPFLYISVTSEFSWGSCGGVRRVKLWRRSCCTGDLEHIILWDCAQGGLPKAMGHFYGTLAWIPGFWAHQGLLMMSPQLDTLIAAHWQDDTS